MLVRKARSVLGRIRRHLDADERAFDRAWPMIDQVSGLLISPHQERWMFMAARGLPDGANIVEIGSFKGLAEVVAADLAALDPDKRPSDWREMIVSGELQFDFLDAERRVPAVTGKCNGGGQCGMSAMSGAVPADAGSGCTTIWQHARRYRPKTMPPMN